MCKKTQCSQQLRILTLNRMAEIYLHCGQYAQAKDSLLMAFTLAHDLLDRPAQLLSLRLFAVVFRKIGETQSESDNYSRLLMLDEEIRKSIGIVEASPLHAQMLLLSNAPISTPYAR